MRSFHEKTAGTAEELIRKGIQWTMHQWYQQSRGLLRRPLAEVGSGWARWQTVGSSNRACRQVLWWVFWEWRSRWFVGLPLLYGDAGTWSLNWIDYNTEIARQKHRNSSFLRSKDAFVEFTNELVQKSILLFLDGVNGPIAVQRVTKKI